MENDPKEMDRAEREVSQKEGMEEVPPKRRIKTSEATSGIRGPTSLKMCRTASIETRH